jgi:hypothetical protein
MFVADGLNIVDKALNMAVLSLENRGLPREEAQIALLIRLLNVVPEEVAEIAQVLRNDDELSSAINKKVSPQISFEPNT